MEMKKCSKCGELKPLSEFYIRRDQRTYRAECKKCTDKRNSDYLKTKRGVVYSIYVNQKKHSKKRGHAMPSYTSEELKDWLYSQKKFHELYDKWRTSDYDMWLRPSCDRLDDYKPYTLDNLRVVTLKENVTRSYSDRKNGINNKTNKAVLQFAKNGDFIKEYHSVSEATRQTKIHHISSVCLGKRMTAGGFIWKFKN